jgi:hypothetical protein
VLLAGAEQLVSLAQRAIKEPNKFWSFEEFTPIACALESLFKKKGWL